VNVIPVKMPASELVAEVHDDHSVENNSVVLDYILCLVTFTVKIRTNHIVSGIREPKGRTVKHDY
jgi:hypothetical protein